MTDWESAVSKIEALVRDRRSFEYRRAIPAFLREHSSRSEEATLRACDWYRRLGQHREGLRCLDPDDSLSRTPKTEFDRQRKLWAARFLNLMGATEFAQLILKNFEPRGADEHRILGAVFLAHFDYDRAAYHLGRFNQLDSEPERYLSRLSQINLADALNGLGQTPMALKLATNTLERSPEPLLQGIALQAHGEYLARNARWQEALESLIQARTRFSHDDQTPDMGFLLKWQGFVELKMGQKASGRKNLMMALNILRESTLRPEAWLDVYRLLADAGELESNEIERLAAYPGLAPGFKKTLPGVVLARPKSGKAPWVINLDRNEYSVRNQSFLGIPIEIRAMAFIAQAGAWGLPVVKLKSILWPGEVHAFFQLEGRINQILLRLREEHDCRIEVKRSTVYLRQPKVVAEGTGEPSSRPRFLEMRKEFTRSEVESCYRLAPAQAARWISNWIENAWISKLGNGPRSRYSVVAADCVRTTRLAQASDGKIGE